MTGLLQSDGGRSFAPLGTLVRSGVEDGASALLEIASSRYRGTR